MSATTDGVTGAAPTITPAGVAITGLTKTFDGRRGRKTVVDDLDLIIDPGELVSLLGPSGCGKTTTLRMVAGFLTADSGSIEVDGHDVSALPPERRPTAMVFQNYALWPHMTVFGNIAYPLRIRRLPRPEISRRVDRILELVNLSHHRDSRPATISGGEQQRVALARALVQEPKVLLLDEPLSNLDAKLRIKVREDIRSLQQRLQITTLLVTHDQDEALSMSDRIAVMNGGRIEQFSPPEELYAAPQTEFVASFVGSLNQLPGRWVDRGLVAEDGVSTAIRPEDVLLDVPDGIPADVVRIIPRGHFTEVVVQLAPTGQQPGTTLRSFSSGLAVRAGDPTTVSVRRTMIFANGRRVAD